MSSAAARGLADPFDGIPVKTANFTSFDGTSIVYDIVGEGDVPVLLANGFGGNTEAWAPLVRPMLHRCTFYCPDYRGLFRSDTPEDRNAYTIADHAGDFEALLRHQDLSRVVMIGWSMGCKVSLELFRRHPHRVRAFVFLNGADQLPIRHLIPDSPKLFGLLHSLGERASPVTGWFNRRAVSLADHPKLLARLLRLVGSVDKNIDEELGSTILKRFLKNDPEAVWKIAIEILNFSARDIAHKVRVPSLVVTGERDKLIPKHTMVTFAAGLPHGSMVVIPRATHYALLEYPDVVALHVESFLEDIGIFSND